MDYGFIERLRGIDKWPFVQATVTSTEQLSEGGRGGSSRKVTFIYPTDSGQLGGTLRVDSYSSTYELGVGDTFEVQYDPRKPSRYFCEEARSLFSTLHRVMLTLVIGFIVLEIAAQVFHW